MDARAENKKRILVVDDDPAFQESTRVILESEGYEVRLAGDSRAGLESLARVNPDLIILDVMMADSWDGYRFARALQEDGRYRAWRDVPIIMLTAAYEDAMFQFETHPLREFVHVHDLASKPLSPQQLIDRVARHLSPETGRG